MYRGQRLHVLTRGWKRHYDRKELVAQISDQMRIQNTYQTSYMYITANFF